MHRLTDTAIKAALRTGKARTLSDGGTRGDGALILRIADTGGAAWYVKRWRDGRPALVKLGAWPAVTLADARRRYRDHTGAAKTGETPRDTVQRIARDRAALASFADLAAAYCDHLAARRSAPETRRLLLSGPDAAARCLPDGPANAITPADVAAWLARWAARGTIAQGEQARAMLRAAFSFGMAFDFDPRRYVNGAAPPRFAILSNPAAAVPTFGARGAGVRWLTADEIAAFWAWTGAKAGRTDSRALNALRLILASGQRVEQIMRLSDFHLSRAGWLSWDASEMKKARPHAVPAVGIVADLVRRAVEAPRPKPGLFCPGAKAGAYQGRSLNWILRRCCADTGLAPFSPRDLRRTWRTHAGEAGLSSEQCAAIMAHPFGAAVEAKHYNAGNNDRLKQEASEVMAIYWQGLGMI